jgi:hypothetical protein
MVFLKWIRRLVSGKLENERRQPDVVGCRPKDVREGVT